MLGIAPPHEFEMCSQKELHSHYVHEFLVAMSPGGAYGKYYGALKGSMFRSMTWAGEGLQ